MKKYLILFISIFCSFFLIDKVNAADNGIALVNNTDFIRYSISYEEELRQGTWEYIGDLYGNSNSAAVRLYYNKGTRTQLGFKLAGAIHIADNMSIYEYINGFEFTNLAYISSTSSGYRNHVILSSGDLPILGGDCASGSYCFMWRNSGLQGNRQSATIRSNTIFLDYLDLINNVVYGSSRFYDYNNGVTYVGTDSNFIELSTSNMDSSNFKVYSTQEVKNNGNYTITNTNLFTLEGEEPEATYTISDGSDIGKKIIFNFSNFETNSYADITNLTTGDIIHLIDLNVNNSYVIDNISFDSVYFIEVFNNDSLVFVDTIDINEEVRLANKPYINLTLDKERLIAWLEFMNLKPDYHVYYSKNNGEFTEVFLEENKNSILVGFNNEQSELHNKNYTIHGKITDSNNNILYERGYNIVFFPDSPYFTFKSSYNSDSGCNQLTITYHNFLNSDIVSYSYDNTNYENFSNIKTNVLEVCYNSPIYVKATRGNDVYYGYYYVNVSEFSSSSNESFQQEFSLLTTFNNLFTGIDLSFLNNINSFFNALKSSYVFRFIMLCITGALILFIMRLIRR